MSDPVFDAVLRREKDQADAAVMELLRLVADELVDLVEDLPVDEQTGEPDLAGLVASEEAKAGVRRALYIARRGQRRPTPTGDRSVATLADLSRQLLEEGYELERAALEMTGPDFVNAHQGRALGLRQAGLRIHDWYATHRAPVDRESVPA